MSLAPHTFDEFQDFVRNQRRYGPFMLPRHALLPINEQAPQPGGTVTAGPAVDDTKGTVVHVPEVGNSAEA